MKNFCSPVFRCRLQGNPGGQRGEKGEPGEAGKRVSFKAKTHLGCIDSTLTLLLLPIRNLTKNWNILFFFYRANQAKMVTLVQQASL